MDSADQTKQTLVYADGYSYTEIFQAPAIAGMPGNSPLITIFHAFFTAEDESPCSADRSANGTYSASNASGKIG
ncbi:hypothetical protein [Stutzerimonas zhaodongensis]|jgi:hypothetical protein|uniref:Uncharacterized protein n=1 Tax=Stutzerimonas zhaodongensis TaxID=1176257 RepID=A0A365PTR3_9GAMM|nr:hypothetical protein [Stutzerimonas zhaodongensis]QWV16379.1 hypothetical protein KQ248_18050 [Stutzerimonas zhaodongensis]RBA57425.1 hypothetical protein DQ403_12335 [Stutzerimonas zhaodongensis]